MTNEIFGETISYPSPISVDSLRRDDKDLMVLFQRVAELESEF